MSANNKLTSVSILDKDYQVACPPEEKPALLQAAEELDQRMKAIRSSGSIIGLERIAVMAALNLCYELHESRADGQQKSKMEASSSASLRELSSRIEAALGNEQA